MYIELNHCIVHQKLIQHWKSTTIKKCFSLKKLKNKHKFE